MKISILTICPEAFGDFLNSSLTKRAVDKGILEIEIVDIKSFAGGSFRHIDDSSFGGGAGMVMRCCPIIDTLNSVRCERSQVIAMTPGGETYTQRMAHEFTQAEHLIFICGHYEGIDERVFRHVDKEISLGDFILSGGELAVQVIMDSIIRLLPGVLRNSSTMEESFENGLLEYPQYTQPADYQGDKVPEVLLSGNHEKIRRWRLKESLKKTKERRPDLLKDRCFTEEELQILKELENDL